MQKKTRRATALGGTPTPTTRAAGPSKAASGPATSQGQGTSKSSSKTEETPFLAAAASEDSGLATAGGTWHAAHHEDISSDTQRGTDIKLHFTPNSLCNASKIQLTQTCSVFKHRKGAPKAGPTFGKSIPRRSRAVKAPGQERASVNIDRSDGYSSPFFGVGDEDLNRNKDHLADKHDLHQSHKDSDERSGEGSRLAGATAGTDAWLHDRVRQDWKAGETLDAKYETIAVATEGTDKGIVYGSVVWGFKVDATGNITREAPKVKSVGNATDTFHSAMDAWNNQDSYEMSVTINRAKEGQPQDLVSGSPFFHFNDTWELPRNDIPTQDAMPANATERTARLTEIDEAMDTIKSAKPDDYAKDRTYRQLAFERRAVSGS